MSTDRKQKIGRDIASKELEDKKCSENIELLEQQKKRVEYALVEYYNLNVLYGKYRNIIATHKILEYMESGRCLTLYGASGAYDTYEKERRMDLVIDSLEKMKKHNRLLAQSMDEIKRSLGSISRGIITQKKLIDDIEMDLQHNKRELTELKNSLTKKGE